MGVNDRKTVTISSEKGKISNLKKILYENKNNLPKDLPIHIFLVVLPGYSSKCPSLLDKRSCSTKWNNIFII